MSEPPFSPPQSDHDAVVTLVSEVRHLRDDFKDLREDIHDIKNDLANRVANLEQGKLGIVDFESFKKEVEKQLDDKEKRTRLLEEEQSDIKGRYAVIWGLGIIVLSAVVSIVARVFTKGP